MPGDPFPTDEGRDLAADGRDAMNRVLGPPPGTTEAQATAAAEALMAKLRAEFTGEVEPHRSYGIQLRPGQVAVVFDVADLRNLERVLEAGDRPTSVLGMSEIRRLQRIVKDAR